MRSGRTLGGREADTEDLNGFGWLTPPKKKKPVAAAKRKHTVKSTQYIQHVE